MTAWEDLVILSDIQDEKVQEHYHLSTDDCEAIRLLLKYDLYKPEIPSPTEFTEIVARLMLERTYDEVSPFPKINCVKIALRLLKGEKILQWRRLAAGKEYPGLRPFKAYRSIHGIAVQFIDPKAPLGTLTVPYCRRDCVTPHGNQCARFGSYSQIELSPFLPYWPDRCSIESALNCPMRLATGAPKPDPEDPIIKDFQEWCKTRVGYKKP